MPTPLPFPQLFARLVAFDTTSHHPNLPLADFLCSYLERPGVRITRNLSADGLKTNLVIEVGPETAADGQGLVLSAHMDVVPAGEGWESDPFTLTEAGDRYIARGSADMKGFLALAVEAAASVDPTSLAAPLVLVLTYDEELGCLGAERLFRTWPREHPLPRSCVVGEPTSLAAVRMHKGHLKMRITVSGTSAHSGYPHLGRNAIEPAGRVVVALSELRRQLESERSRHSGHFPETPFVALNVGRITGGTAINVVPERCMVEVGLRPLPEMDSAELAERVERAASAVVPAERLVVEVIGDSPAMLLAAEAPIVRAVGELSGQREAGSASYGTDAGWLSKLGLECVIFGPGTIEVAHKPNEWIPKAEIETARGAIAMLIERFCRFPETPEKGTAP